MKKQQKTKHRKTLPSKKHAYIRAFLRRMRFMPALGIALFATYTWVQPQLALGRPSGDVLAYATNISPAGLLSATNAQRTSNGAAALASNGLLNSAAQAKANDMVARNYWSHQTPDGQQPWVFVTSAGYQYLSAGENLAYGFMTSAATITGWMNSPSHRANLLSTNFTEVGFGIANSADYVGNGPQTVVVAMYGKPQATTPPAPTPTPQPQPTPKPVTQGAQSAQPTKKTEPVAEKPADTAPVEPEDKKEVTQEDTTKEEPIAVAATEQTPPPTATTTQVRRIQVMTGGSAIWSATFVVLGVSAIGILWLTHRGFRFKKWIVSTEKLVGKYLHLDLTVLSIIYLGFVLLSTTGTIR